jgi:hypothetical protein
VFTSDHQVPWHLTDPADMPYDIYFGGNVTGLLVECTVQYS